MKSSPPESSRYHAGENVPDCHQRDTCFDHDAWALFAAPPQKRFSLTIDNIMRGPNLVGTEPTQVRWSGDSTKIYFGWKKASDPASAPLDTYEVGRDGSGMRKLSVDEARLAPPAVADINNDRSWSVFSQDRDIVLIENATGKRRQVTRTAEAETNPRFQPDGRHISFQRGGNLFLLSLDNGDLEQLTDIRPAVAAGTSTPPAANTGRGGQGGAQIPEKRTDEAGGDRPKPTTIQDYLKKEQAEFFEVVRDREKLQKENEERRKKLNPRKPYMLQPQQTVAQMQLAPDGKYVLAILSDASPNAKPSNVPNWITDSSFPEEIPGRLRVGDEATHRHLSIINVVTGEVKPVEHGELGVSAAQVEDGGSCGGHGGNFGPGSSGTLPATFSEDGTKAVFTARAQDNKTCWVLALDSATANARVLIKDQDKAWIGGPEGGQGWLGDNQTFYYTSECDGFNHLYEISYDGETRKQLTSGPFEIDRVELSRDKSLFYITSSQGDFAERNLWSMPVKGGPATRITKAVGMHAVTISPDEKSVADVYSYTNKPPELYIQPNENNAGALKVTTSP